MPWRLIGFIIILGLFLGFIVCNLGNKCDISFGFRVFTDVPVFLTAFASFILGMFCALPFIFRARRKKGTAGGAVSEAGKKKGKKGGGTGAGGGADSPLADNSFSNGGPYGIN